MKTDLSQLVNLNFDGLNFLNMGPNSIWWSDLSPVQFVPSGQVLPPIYHTKNRRQFWFSEQIANWINQNNYWNPWQTSDTMVLQFITNGLTPVVANLYKCSSSTTIISSTTATLKSSPAVISPQQLWEVTIPLATLDEGGYYLNVLAGTAGAQANIISEGLWVKQDWPGTLLFEYTSSQNKQMMFFDTGIIGRLRVKGFYDNQAAQKYKGAFYVDEPQDISILNAIQYEIMPLVVGSDDGVPDYIYQKVVGALLLDGCRIEGEGFSLNEGSEWETIFTPGNPKKFPKVDIRPSSTTNATGATAAGADTDSSMLITVDADAFAPNAGGVPGDSQIIDVTIS